jgi:hypothetical protein
LERRERLRLPRKILRRLLKVLKQQRKNPNRRRKTTIRGEIRKRKCLREKNLKMEMLLRKNLLRMGIKNNTRMEVAKS